MMHWAICYSSRVSAVRPRARSPPTARQPAWRQRSAFSSLYLSWSGGTERWLAQRLVGGCWASCTCSLWSCSEHLNLQPDSPELVSSNVSPLSSLRSTRSDVKNELPSMTFLLRLHEQRSQSGDGLQHHLHDLHADVVGCYWGWNGAQVKTREKSFITGVKHKAGTSDAWLKKHKKKGENQVTQLLWCSR